MGRHKQIQQEEVEELRLDSPEDEGLTTQTTESATTPAKGRKRGRPKGKRSRKHGASVCIAKQDIRVPIVLGEDAGESSISTSGFYCKVTQAYRTIGECALGLCEEKGCPFYKDDEAQEEFLAHHEDFVSKGRLPIGYGILYHINRQGKLVCGPPREGSKQQSPELGQYQPPELPSYIEVGKPLEDNSVLAKRGRRPKSDKTEKSEVKTEKPQSNAVEEEIPSKKTLTAKTKKAPSKRKTRKTTKKIKTVKKTVRKRTINGKRKSTKKVTKKKRGVGKKTRVRKVSRRKK
jgi:hypothetical protein